MHNTLELMSLDDSGLVNHKIANRHLEDTSVCHFNRIKKRPLHTQTFAIAHVESSRTVLLFQEMHKFMRGKRSPSLLVPKGLLQFTQPRAAHPVQGGGYSKIRWKKQGTRREVFV